jgi:hypothetical protein
VGMQEVRWRVVAPNLRGNTHFSTERGMRNLNWVQVVLFIRESYQQLRGFEFVCDKMSYIITKCRWCRIIVLNVHAPTDDKTDDVKDSFYEELEHVFKKFPKHNLKILLGDFSVKVSKGEIFRKAIENEGLNEVNEVNF